MNDEWELIMNEHKAAMKLLNDPFSKIKYWLIYWIFWLQILNMHTKSVKNGTDISERGQLYSALLSMKT